MARHAFSHAKDRDMSLKEHLRECVAIVDSGRV